MIAWRETLRGAAGGAIAFALTDRLGGFSTGPYEGLNLAVHVGDAPPAVAANRRALATAIGVDPDRLVVAEQVHGVHVQRVETPWPDRPARADALLTSTPGLVLAVLVADCVPVLLAAPAEGIVGVAHAGRAGMAGGVVTALVAAMRAAGAGELVGRVGPSICPRCYEVPLDLRERVAAAAPEARSVTRRGTPSLDVAAGVLAQLAPHCADLEQRDGCTRERPDLYSYRRDGTTGRFAGLAWISP